MGLRASKLALAVVCPVPPLIMATIPVIFPASPEIFPVTWEPGRERDERVVSVELVVAVTLEAFPFKVAVIVLAEKLPEPSVLTRVFGVPELLAAAT
jgi:hypothetical protein